ncbi:MAG: TniQ family protein [Methylobacter sp.]|uniref:TniQ family protein n=1 Tax=Methylobacter sp. TaxID=2051955 RepID=UPI00272F662F|nr:TniQ family protein [Methylobacter sp.]MDP1666117.1 TniQ family protein [Methylobacter sp.]
MKNKWDIPIILQPNELLSSWLIRTALANGCDPLIVSWVIWGKWRAWTNDIDRNPGEDRMHTLSKFSGKDLDDLNQSILLPIASTILGREPTANELWPWLLTTGTRNRLRKGGIQYCVECLKEDKKPYFRREWRFAWHVGCSKHGQSLRDSCPHCNAPLEPHRLVAEDREITKCVSCNLRLLDVMVLPVFHADAMLFQIWSDNILNHQQQPVVHGMAVSVSSWFEIARYYESFIRRCLISPPPALQSLSESLNFRLDQNIIADVELIAFEQMNVRARSALLKSIFKLMAFTQDELLHKLTEASVTKQGFSNAKIKFPETLEPIARCLPDNQRAKKKATTRKTNIQLNLPKPRPHWEVNRMWKQLLQKMQDDPDYGNGI